MTGVIHRLPARSNQPTIEPFRPFYASQMQGHEPKPREWLIDGVLLRRSVMVFAGPPKIGKSLLLQQLLTATALGQPWLDRETVQTRSSGLFTEDPQEELERRQTDINTLYDRDPADFELDLTWKSLEGKDAVMVEFDRFGNKPKLTPLWDQFWRFVADEGIQMIGLDNARVIFGGSENFPNQVTAFCRLLVQKAVEINGGIVLAAHPAKNDPRGVAGTGAWLASVRAGMSLHRPADWDEERDTIRDPRRVLAGLGMNYGAGLGAERLELRDGVFVQTDDARPRHRKAGPLSQTEMMDLRYRLLIGMKRILQNGGRVPADEMDAKSMPNRARRSTDERINRIPLNELYRAQQDMIEAGQLVRVDVGRKCLLRPHDGPYYDDEQPWLPAPAPRPETKNAAD